MKSASVEVDENKVVLEKKVDELLESSEAKKIIIENEPISGEKSQGNRMSINGVRNKECPC